MSQRLVMKDEKGRTVLVRSEVLLASPEVAEAQPPGDSSRQADDPPEGTPPQLQTSVKPPDVPWDEWRRRGDAVRSAAREFDAMDQGDAREYLKGRINRDLEEGEINQFLHDVSVHRVGDLTDVFDNSIRSTVDQMKRARRTVRTTAPRGWTNRAFNALSEQQAGQVIARLSERGHTNKAIIDRVLSRIKDEDRRQRLKERLEEGQLSVELAQEQ